MWLAGIQLGDERALKRIPHEINLLIKQWVTMKCQWALDKWYDLRN